MTNTKTLQGISICVDPGHGGLKDPGAIDPVNPKEHDKLDTKEKDINLEVALKLHKKLTSYGARSSLTRGSDFYPSLAKRCEIANDMKADLFICIHANSGSPEAKGIETLYNPKSTKGLILAELIQEELIKGTGANDRGPKPREDLYVLNGTKMPSALIEMGFITNPFEEIKLRDDKYQNKIVDGIYRAILQYFKKYPKGKM